MENHPRNALIKHQSCAHVLYIFAHVLYICVTDEIYILLDIMIRPVKHSRVCMFIRGHVRVIFERVLVAYAFDFNE